MRRRVEVSRRRAPQQHGRVTLRWRRARRRVRPYPGRSPKAEAFQRALYVVGDRWPRRSEQREFGDRRVSFARESRNRLTKQFCLAASALPRDPRQRPLELRWKIHRGLRHALCIPYIMPPASGIVIDAAPCARRQGFVYVSITWWRALLQTSQKKSVRVNMMQLASGR